MPPYRVQARHWISIWSIRVPAVAVLIAMLALFCHQVAVAELMPPTMPLVGVVETRWSRPGVALADWVPSRWNSSSSAACTPSFRVS